MPKETVNLFDQFKLETVFGNEAEASPLSSGSVFNLPSNSQIAELTVDEEDEIPEDVIKKFASPEEEETDELDESEEDEERDDEETDDNPVEPEEEDDDESFSILPIANILKQKGLITSELEGFKDDPEALLDAITENADKIVEEKFNRKLEGLPPIVQELADFILNKGGNVATFLAIQSEYDNLEELDLTHESDQERVVTAYLRTQEYTNEEINETIANFKEGSILDREAKRAQQKYSRFLDKQKEQAEVEAVQARQVQLKQEEERISTIESYINKADNIAGLAIDKSEKEKFFEWLTKPGRDGLTGYVKSMKDNILEESIKLAYLKYKDFNYTKVASETKKEAALELKKAFKKATEKKPKSSGSQRRETAPADLSGFRGLL